MNPLLQPLTFRSGSTMANRFMLAPLTNTQSHEDGALSDEEYRWLTMRAQGGFGLTMTCAAHVQAGGKGFLGQLGVWSDDHLDGLGRLAAGIQAHGSLAVVQLHHAGLRSPHELLDGPPVAPSDHAESGARGLSLAEVERLVDDFVAAAVRAERAGFDGVEIHGAHGYILCQFFSAEVNRRDDAYGGSVANRYRILFEIVEGVRARCRDDFVLGVRLSPERWGIRLSEAVEIAQRLMADGRIDFLDVSLWDVFKEPEESDRRGRTLMSYFTELDRGDTRLGVAGKIRTPQDAEATLAAGVDWIMLGHAAILQHDFPNRYAEDPTFAPVSTPVTREYLEGEGVSERFVAYLSRRPGFVVGVE